MLNQTCPCSLLPVVSTMLRLVDTTTASTPAAVTWSSGRRKPWKLEEVARIIAPEGGGGARELRSEEVGGYIVWYVKRWITSVGWQESKENGKASYSSGETWTEICSRSYEKEETAKFEIRINYFRGFCNWTNNSSKSKQITQTDEFSRSSAIDYWIGWRANSWGPLM